MSPWIRSILAVAALLATPVVAPAQSAPAGGNHPSELVPVLNARVPLDGVLSGGQPTAEQIALASRAGFRTVINLRTDQEAGFEWEREAVERGGMRYVHIPIAGSDGLTREHVEQLDAELRRGLADGPVLLHCASGNRIGAMLALRAAWLEGVDPEKALQFGREAGMTRLEDTTRELLGIAPPETPAPKPAP